MFCTRLSTAYQHLQISLAHLWNNFWTTQGVTNLLNQSTWLESRFLTDEEVVNLNHCRCTSRSTYIHGTNNAPSLSFSCLRSRRYPRHQESKPTMRLNVKKTQKKPGMLLLWSSKGILQNWRDHVMLSCWIHQDKPDVTYSILQGCSIFSSFFSLSFFAFTPQHSRLEYLYSSGVFSLHVRILRGRVW